MNRKDIIRMARNAGLVGLEQGGILENFQRFAELVAQAEREACARLAEDQWETVGTQRRTAERCAAAIRARGSDDYQTSLP